MTVLTLYYKATHVLGLVPGLDSNIVPLFKPVQDTFAAGCAADGGTMKASITASGAAFLSSHSLPVVAIFSNGCPDKSGITYDTDNQAGVVCFQEELACRP
jgi:hypothetical protein